MIGKSGEGVKSSKPGEQQEPIIRDKYGLRWFKISGLAKIFRFIFQARIGLLLAKTIRHIFPFYFAKRSKVHGYDRHCGIRLSDVGKI